MLNFICQVLLPTEVREEVGAGIADRGLLQGLRLWLGLRLELGRSSQNTYKKRAMSMAFAHCEICSIKIPRRRYGSSRGSSSRSRGSIDHRREREAEREAAPSGSSCRNQVAAPGARRVATQCQRIPYAPLASSSSWRRLCSFCLQLCSHALPDSLSQLLCLLLHTSASP